MNSTDEMRTHFYDQGYLVVPQVLNATEVRELQVVCDEFVETSRSLQESANGLELAPGHTPHDPRLRRINGAHRAHRLFQQMVTHHAIMGVATALLGPNVRFHHAKLTFKLAHHGEAVEWHQDWAFFPQTNDSMLEIGVCIDDVGEDNGPLMVIPGSHVGPVMDHHHNGCFAGTVAASELRDKVESAVSMTGPAGSITVHHVRTLHGARRNTSDRSRRVLLLGYAAADAWPIAVMPGFDPNAYYAGTREGNALEAGMVVAGSASNEARMEAVPLRLPLPVKSSLSIYGVQDSYPDRSFA
jgi:phytanoyl-CoA hydroxylase